MRALFFVLIAGTMVLGCGPQSHVPDAGPADAGPPPEIPPIGASASETIGSEGGTIALGDFELDVPAGALASPTEITVTVTDVPVPDAFTAFSPVFRFAPEGLVFAAPIQVRIPFLGDTSTGTIFWTTAGATSFAPLATSVEGRIAIADATHFSQAFVGTACAGTECCSRANGDLDVLLMVDSSSSMNEEQALLNEQIPRMARALATGDLNEDGVQDVPALTTLRIGSVTSDMGVGGNYGVPTCPSADFGDDGILRTAGAESPECAASYPAFAELDTSDPSASIDGFVTQVGCVARVGASGCGFEQQLEAVLKALTPSSSPTRFVFETTGHGDAANAGFVRESSILATILLTDENDCSTSDPALFGPTGPYAGTDLNLRCWAYPTALHPVARYVDGLRALRANPDDAIFALIGGVPADLVSDPSAIDYDALLADPRMTEQLDSSGFMLTPSCTSERGIAFPPRRMVEVARDFGENGIVQSICQADFTPVIDAILTRVARRVSGACAAP